MISKVARLLGVATIASAPLLGFGHAAMATNGCSVDNASVSGLHLKIVIELPPPSVGHDFSSESCSYTTAGPNVAIKCTLIAGRCTVADSTHELWRCTAVNSICTNTVPVTAGETITLTVDGGSGSVTDAA